MYLLKNRKKHIPVHRVNYILTFLKRPVLVLVALCMVLTVDLSAQAVAGWEKSYPSSGTDEGTVILQTRDEGLLIAGYQFGNRPYIIKTDPDGEVLWENEYGQINPNGQFKDIAWVGDGYIVVGYETDGTGRDVLILKINDAGEQQWAATYGGTDDDEGLSITTTNDGGFAVVGYTTTSADAKEVYLLKFDASGNLLWSQTFGDIYDDQGNGIIEAANGDLIIVGYTEINSNAPQALLLNVAADGTLAWFNQLTGGNVATDLVEVAAGGNFAIAGYSNIPGDFSAKLIIANSIGGSVSVESFGNDTYADEFRSIIKAHNDEGFILAGFTEISALDIEAYLVKTDLSGNTIWERTFGKTNLPDEFLDVVPTFNGGYIMTGSKTLPGFIDTDFYTVKTDEDGRIFSNYVIGNVFRDLNGDCDFDLTDIPVEGWVIEAVGADHNCYGTSDADGNYKILTNTGMYAIQARFPNEYWTSCILSQTINFNAPYDTLDLDFAVLVDQPCTDMEVDITTVGLTPGGTTNYLVTYCNNGTSVADDPFIDVEFDESYTINSSNPPFQVVNGLLRFNVSDLDPLECGEILINVTIDAASVVGKTHSAKAFAYPNEFCATSGDGSDFEVNTECVNGEVQLTLSNKATATGTATSDFVIVEDMLLLKKSSVQLEPGQDTTFIYPGTGPTYRIIAEQTDGHIGDSRPSEAIEGCVSGGATFSTGFVNQLPEDDYNHFLSVDCQENQNTLTNESRGYPKGYDSENTNDPEHQIQQCADLKYHHRYFYTGPDTAIRVVIRDTLSPFLDPASVRPGVSNHEYTMDVYACGILKFTFENIMLTGGSADPDESMVFVKYRVSQKLDNPVGSVVDNSAATYFGYHAPAKTDSIFHTIAPCELELFMDLHVSTDEIFVPGVHDIKVYPNPFVDQATVEVVADRILEDLEFKLYDLSGRLLRNESFTGMTYQLYRGDLIGGMYIYKIESAGMPVSGGKLLVK